MKTITSEQFEKEVLQAEKPVMVKFTASWCKPCQVLQPIIDEVAKEVEGSAHVYKLDIDESSDIAAKYKVKGVPTMMVFENGKVINTQVGSTSKANLLKLFPSKA